MLRMDEMPSARFRREYAKLTQATTVTVNGHMIGIWIPRGGAAHHIDLSAHVVPEGQFSKTLRERGFNSRPFTPVPKSGSRTRG